MWFDKASIIDMDPRKRGYFINALSGYKSANLVGTQGESGVANLAIVSSVFHIGADPALVGMISRPHTVTRDTLENIQGSGWYTLNHVGESIVEAAHQTSARYSAEESEFEAVGLKPLYRDLHPAPYVEQSQIQVGLALREYKPLDINQTVMVIGEIMEVFVPEFAIRDDGSVDMSSLNTVAISGLDEYNTVNSLARYSYAKPGQPLKKL